VMVWVFLRKVVGKNPCNAGIYSGLPLRDSGPETP